MGRSVDFNNMRMKKPGTFPAIAESKSAPSTTGTGRQTTTEEALEIDGDIRPGLRGDLPQPLEKTPRSARTAKPVAGKKHGASEIGIIFEEGGEGRIDHPRHFQPGKGLFQ